MIRIKKAISTYLVELQAALQKVNVSDIKKVAQVMLTAYEQDQTIFIFGNGGSATTASHMACDLLKGTLANAHSRTEKRLKVLSLTDNVAAITAFANDHSYNEIFVQQLKSLVKPQDLVIGISASGNSLNVIKAFQYAKKQGAITISFLGFRGGKAKKFVDYNIIIPSNNYGVIEDIHSSLNHILTSVLASQKLSKNLTKGDRSKHFVRK